MIDRQFLDRFNLPATTIATTPPTRTFLLLLYRYLYSFCLLTYLLLLYSGRLGGLAHLLFLSSSPALLSQSFGRTSLPHRASSLSLENWRGTLERRNGRYMTDDKQHGCFALLGFLHLSRHLKRPLLSSHFLHDLLLLLPAFYLGEEAGTQEKEGRKEAGKNSNKAARLHFFHFSHMRPQSPPPSLHSVSA